MMTLSKYIHALHIGNGFMLYHAITAKVIFISEEQFEGLRNGSNTVFSDSQLEILSKKGFLSDENEFSTDHLLHSNHQSQPDVFALYLILTEECNMQCTYCSQSSFRTRERMKNMSSETVESVLGKFYSVATERKRTIVLYGGEPTLNRDGIEKVVAYVREKRNDWNTEIVIFTNGILLDDAFIDLLQKGNVYVILSMDGDEKTNDTFRRYGQEGSFKYINMSIDKFKEKRIQFGFSLTIASHNIDRLDEIVKFFIEEYHPFSIGINPLHYVPEGRACVSVDFDYASEKMIDAYKVAAEYGVYIEQIMRRVRPFVMSTPRLKDCPSCGGMVRVLPDGSFGPCGHFMEEEREREDADYKFEKSRVMQKWNSRINVRIDECESCPAIALCGGGCPYNSLKNHGDIFSANDKRTCTQADFFLKWMLSELVSEYYDNQFKEVTQQEKRMLLGNISLEAFVPMQEYSKYGEFKIDARYL